MILTNCESQSYELKGVIFDMDGLIFDSERLFFRHKQTVARDYGYEITEEQYCETLGLTGDTLMNRLHLQYGESYPAEEISQKTRQSMMAAVAKDGLPIKDGIVALLKFLEKNHIPCAIASSTHLRYIKEYLRQTGLQNYFAAIIGGDMIAHSKPAPDIFLKAADGIQCAPEHALVLEDSENGIRAAQRAHIPVICIPDMKYPAQEYIELTFALVENAREVIKMLH
jgi:HAD superfamily hydrolase (TIGR01509 family)